MPRLSKSLPKYSKHRASGQAVVTLSGRDFYLGPHGTKASKLEYDRLIAEWLANGRRLTEEDRDDSITVVELAKAYFEHARQYYVKDGRSTSEVNDLRVVLRDLRAVYGRTAANEFGPSKLKAVRQVWINRGLARTTINQHTSRLIRVFRWAVAEEIVEPSVIHGLTAVAGLRKGRGEAKEPAPVLPVEDAAIEATLPHLPEVVADMVRFQRLTGCRPGELFVLRPRDVDRSSDVWAYRPESHKTQHHGRERVIHIGPRAQAVLARYLLRHDDAYCFSPRESEHKRLAQRHSARTTPLNVGNRPGTNRSAGRRRAAGVKYNAASYRRAIRRACEKANITTWSPNQLRHTAATKIRSKYGLEASRTVLGHTKADTTLIYAERDHRLAADVIREVG